MANALTVSCIFLKRMSKRLHNRQHRQFLPDSSNSKPIIKEKALTMSGKLYSISRSQSRIVLTRSPWSYLYLQDRSTKEGLPKYPTESEQSDRKEGSALLPRVKANPGAHETALPMKKVWTEQ